ncbi:hypothetical protein [Actinomadura monticuli]|uniref:Integral membrane protein n=1 Tax=Actinomadura monticuli TaxID=3097367 RepID=A0ABV4QCE6_9ACTN
MSNGARHGLGVVAGVVLTPVVMLCLMYGAGKLRIVYSFGIVRFQSYHGKELWIGLAVLAVAGVLLGLLAGSRLSPVASLVAGAFYAVIGLIWLMSPRWAITHPDIDSLPRDLRYGYTMLGPVGVFFVLGVLLLVASLAPSRWKARAAAGAAPRYAGPPPAPMGPPPMHGVGAPMGAPQPPQGPSWQGAPQYGAPGAPPAPPARPAASNPPPLPSAAPAPAAQEQPKPSGDGGSDDDEPGEWTRMYGGNRPK